MLFYDRELVLAAYAATLELVIVSALFCASLEGKEVANKVAQQLGCDIVEFQEELVTTALPLDVENLVEHYVKEQGRILLQRYPIYREMFQTYQTGEYIEKPRIDRLLCRANQLLGDNKLSQVHKILGHVGAKMLRGEHLRPFWFRIAHPHLQSMLAGLQTVVNNFSVASYFTFPLADIETEQKK